MALGNIADEVVFNLPLLSIATQGYLRWPRTPGFPPMSLSGVPGSGQPGTLTPLSAALHRWSPWMPGWRHGFGVTDTCSLSR
jgi:hypothetical protein